MYSGVSFIHLQTTCISGPTTCYFKGNVNQHGDRLTHLLFCFALLFGFALLVFYYISFFYLIFVVLFCFISFAFCFVLQDYVLRQVEPKYHKLGWPNTSPDASFMQTAYQAE